NNAFKVWHIDPVLKNVARVVLLLIAIAIVAAVYYWWNAPLPDQAAQRVTDLATSSAAAVKGLTFQKIVTYIYDAIVMMLVFAVLAKVLTALLGTFASKYAIGLIRWKDTLKRIALGVVVSTIGFVASVTHVYIFDRRFLSLGTLQKVKDKNG
ncbi:MAG TPA: hypothetical protein VF435_06635, partial [Pyrinomonadaceae bacterium]